MAWSFGDLVQRHPTAKSSLRRDAALRTGTMVANAGKGGARDCIKATIGFEDGEGNRHIAEEPHPHIRAER